MLRNLICLLLAAATLVAQSEAGGASLSGAVTDPTGAVIRGAKVSALSRLTGFRVETVTNDEGLYTFPRLPVGSYDVTAEMAGFQQARRTELQLKVGAVATLDIQLAVGATEQTMSVTADIPVVETARSQTSSVVDDKAVASLPINGRNFLDFTLLTPGVVRDPRGGDLSFGGQRGTSNSLLVDGGDSNNVFFGQSSGRAGTRNPYSFSQESVQEFQVNTNGYGAEQGRAGGGLVNVITKSGTNELHGSVFWFFRDKGLNANTFTNNFQNRPKQPYHFNQFGASVGGPVVKDKLFYFFNYEGQRNTRPNAVFLSQPAVASDPDSVRGFNELQQYLSPYTQNFDNNIYLGKVDWNVSANQRLNIRYNAHRFKGKNLENAGSASAAEHTGDSNVTTDNVALTYSKVFGTNLVYEGRYIFLRDDEPGQANSTAPETVIRQNNATVLNFGRNNFSPRYTNTKRNQIVQSVSYIRGRHSYKMGADLNFEKIDNFFPGLFSGAYSFNSYAEFARRQPFNFTQALPGANTDGPLTRPNISEYAFYVQDAWRVSQKLTLNYGVRYDLMDSADPKVTNPDAGLAALGLNTGRMNLDTNNLGARFGFAYKVLNSDRLVLRGGYGTYFARTPAIMTGTAHSQNGIQVRTYELRGAQMPTYPNILAAPPASGAPPNVYVFAPDYVQPLTHQFSLNMEGEIAPNTSLTVGYLGVRGVHLSRTRDINLFPAIDTAGTLSTGETVTFPRHPGTGGPSRPNSAFGRVSIFDSGADSIYHGMFVQVTRRYARNFQMSANYTWAHVIDTAPNQVSVVVPFDDGLQTQNTLLPNLDRGNGDADVRHRFVLSGVWDINYARGLSNPVLRHLLGGFQLATVTSAQTSLPFTATVSGDPNNDGRTAIDRPPFVGRNTVRGGNIASVDFRVSKDIPLYKERAALKLMFEAFNATNRANFTSLNRGQYAFNGTTRVFTPIATFGQKQNFAGDPRILQVAAKITF